MRPLPAVGATLALVCSILVSRIVFHSYTDHDHLDVFHLVIAIGSGIVALLLARRALTRHT